MDWDGKPYHSLDYDFKRKFGSKTYKVSLDGGMTCPNRDGSLGRRGCIFCSAGGSGEFAEPIVPVAKMRGVFSSPEISETAGQTADNWAAEENVCLQISRAAARIRSKFGSFPEGYVAYFQSYTNTYAPVSYLRNLFTAAIRHPQVRALAIATRPDCLPSEVLELLSSLNEKKPVWVELGLQTIHPKTAAWVRRGYDLSCFEEALANLRQRGIEVVVHAILGLPGEDRAQMLETVSWLGNQEIQGIKLQLLHVLRGTDLATLYEQQPFPIFSMEEYLDLVLECVSILPPHITIHRLTGDGPKSLLIAPLWSANKRLVLNTLSRRFRETGITQGCRLGG